MRRALAAALFLCALGASASSTARLIQLRDHSRILAMDEPVLKGRVFVFHRYPDGVFVSIPAGSVLAIALTKISPPDSAKAKFLAGETIELGPTGQGRARDEQGATAGRDVILAPSSSDSDAVSSYGGYPYIGCCSGPVPPASRPPLAPALVGPNGYPGTPMREIGSNGYPVLAPSPVRR